MDGVENLSADHTSSSASSGMMFFNAFDCWVKGVKDINSDRNHVWLQVTAHTTVRDSYFYGTKNAASQSYGVEPYMSSDNLIENNIFQHVAAAMMVNGAASGTVFGHNFAVDDYYFTPGWMMGSNWLHAAGIDSVLEEGNEGAGFISDDIHGTHHFVTLFRNQFIGWETTKTVQTTAVHLYTHSRYFNVVGNVLGKPGYHSQYQDSTPGGVLSAQSIYTLGWAGNDGTNLSAVLSDPFVIGSLMRWGNYDSVNAAAQWNSSEVPSGLTQFANPVPVNHNLPSSFYLSSKPSWWGSMPWPAVGPDVAGSPDPTGHAYVNPAQACYNSTAKDGSGLLQFNAGACYGSSSAIAPAAPTGLRATVQ